jgi:hypothetical protein
MDIQGYDILLRAATRGDTPRARLLSLLSAVRDSSFTENVTPAEMWITNYEEEGPEAALVLFREGCLKFPEGSGNEGRGAGVVKKSKPAAETYSVAVPGHSQPKAAGYLHFSRQPLAPAEWLQAAAGFIGSTLLELKRERIEILAYGILNSHREKMFQDSGPISQAELNKLGEAISGAFHTRSLWVLLYDFKNWRRSGGKPMVTFRGEQTPLRGAQTALYRRLNKEIYNLFMTEGKGESNKGVGRELRIQGLTERDPEQSFYITAAPLFYPEYSDEAAGIPYLAVVVPNEPGQSLDSYERRLLKKIVIELQRVMRFRDELEYTKGLDSLLQKFLFLSTPEEIAKAVVEYLSTAFSATEVAVLEQRGMFLSFLYQKDVPVSTIPPLYIPTKESLVCDVASNRRERYDANVQKKNEYMQVVDSTKSQFTVPLTWRRELVGVLLIGLSVLDGLEPRHRRIINALAGYCAAAIAGSHRTAEERAASHMLGEVITGAALKIHQVIHSNQIDPAQRTRLEATFDLLDQCQAFLDNFRKAQGSHKQRGRVDLRRIISKYKRSPMLTTVLQEHPGCSVEIKPFPEPLIVYAYEEGIMMALHNIVLNGLEAMEESPGKVSVSMSVKKEWNRASSKNLYSGVIKITDDGVGTPLSEQAKIFELFYTTKPDHLGSGLTIAKRIVEGFGGRLEYISPRPESVTGTEVTLLIPLIIETGLKSDE